MTFSPCKRFSQGREEYIAESDAKEAVSNCWADRGESKCQNRLDVLERFSCTVSLASFAAIIIVVAPCLVKIKRCFESEEVFEILIHYDTLLESKINLDMDFMD